MSLVLLLKYSCSPSFNKNYWSAILVCMFAICLLQQVFKHFLFINLPSFESAQIFVQE
jgi:hypothetical protein